MKSITLVIVTVVALAILGAIAMWSTMQSTISTEPDDPVGVQL